MQEIVKHKWSITVFTIVVLLYIPSILSANCKILSDTVPYKDTLLQVNDSLQKLLIDSSALSAKELRAIAKEKKFVEKQLKREKRDSAKGARDTLRWSEPRILNTYIIPDSLKYKRLITWSHDSRFNNIRMLNPDTTFNENFQVYPFMKNDVGATYLGISGSAAQTHNYFKRERLDLFEPFEPYLVYSNTKESVPFYNTKTPYTEMAFWGTLFANRDKEESNLKIMHTQNLSPSFNLNFTYKRFGAAGLLPKEATDNRTVTMTANYLGKRYILHGGYIFQGIKREENGGVLDDKMVIDTTTEDSKDLEYRLKEADNNLKRNTLFLTHSYGIPVRWSKNDTLAYGEGTMTYFGHSFEYSTYTKKYTDNIDQTDSAGRALYNNMFLFSPTSTFDSLRVSSLENKAFIRIQPWAKDAVISKLDGGIGHQLMTIYNFRPEFYTQGRSQQSHNNIFLYFGALGRFHNYMEWDANARYDLSGYYSGNLSADGRIRFSLYPVEDGIHLTAAVRIDNRTPGWLGNNYYSNHYMWDNEFSNITETKLEGNLEIPKYKLSIFAGYAIINNPVYYGIQGLAAQHPDIVTIMSAYIQKNFKFGFLHLDNRVLFQMSSNKEVIPLPEISANLKYYMQFELVKNVLTAQLGADVSFNTPWFAPAYSPALGLFHNQNDRQIGNYPYIDAFVNLQWKRASIFVKYLNAAQGWPDGDYFSAHHYIRPQTALKIGIHWPFYVK